MRPIDTSHDARRRLAEIFATMTGAEKVAHAMQMAAEAKSVTIAGIRSRHPEWSAAQVDQEWLRLLHGDAVADQISRWTSRS